MLPTIVSFWHGPASWLERLSARSFLEAGHRVEVYSYDSVEGLPSEVVLKDAAEILPRDKLVFYKGRGTPGVFSDYFRASLMAAEKGIWADLDVVCLRPLAELPPLVVSYERPGSVNGAVLRIPSDSPLLAAMLSIFTQEKRPLLEPHLPTFRRLEVAARRLIGHTIRPEDMQYGATGPFALTYYTRALGVGPILPQGVFYPVPYEAIPELLKAGSSIEAFVRPETLAVHLWRSQITRRGRAGMPAPEARSALATLCRRFGIVPAADEPVRAGS
ncbi:hypothetical protein IC608_01535 [Devosia sp. PTR5]|uniref:Alpha 1,4-glycosyltransferase domain-containing protein n=1 Tax=Devosia oryzisoli TaxID=2774138 RepID=A0A927IRX5_9HYPH|nr:hypothetical protein [Devosia oryzisoli]MBD8064158.1 hypothetical protein [Devosia oryzisoli]